MPADILIKGGTIYDGTGADPVVADVVVNGDRVTTVAPNIEAPDTGVVLDASGLAVAPGFVNMLSHSHGALLADPRGMSELTQGVTTQVVGEGWSMGPLTEEMRERQLAQMGRTMRFDMPWLRLSEYLAYAEKKGVSQNIASYIGAATLREHAVGLDDRPATETELDRMRSLVREEMADGALGIASALIYPPGWFASTEELIELCKAASPYGGSYISHLRSEGDDFEGGVSELIRIGREAEVAAEIYHLKPAGQDNWHKLPRVLETIEAARASGQEVRADVYTYTAGGTALRSSIPPWFHDGGPDKFRDRLADPVQRAAMHKALSEPGEGWENLYRASGGAEGVVVLSVRDKALKQYMGMSIAAIAEAEGKDHIDCLLDLVDRDQMVGAAYFIISEDNLKLNLQQPWVTLGSDAAAQAAEGDWILNATHPRSYGNFARFLGVYVRDEKLMSLAEGIRRLTSLPCDNLGFTDRGRLREGAFADVVVFDPDTIADRATYADSHQYSVGVHHVVVNGVLTLRDGAHTGDLGGRALAGPGRR